MVMRFPLGENLNTTVFNDHAKVAKDLAVTLCFYKGKFQIKSADKLSDELCVLVMGQQDTSNELFNLPAFCFRSGSLVSYQTAQNLTRTKSITRHDHCG